MNPVQGDPFARLESAISAWNAKVAGSYPVIVEELAGVRHKLEKVHNLLALRRSISLPIVLARAQVDALNQAPSQRDATVQGVLERIDLLEDELADFQIELETLRAQADRTLRAGDLLTRNLAPFVDAQTADAQPQPTAPAPPAPPAPQPPAPQRPAPAPDERARAQREREFRAEMDAMRSQLEVARRELSAAHNRMGAMQAGEQVPEEIQRELVKLRNEIETLRLTYENQCLPLEGEAARQWDSILRHAFDEAGHRRQMGDILRNAGIITENQLDRALTEQRSSWHRHLGSILVDLGFATEESIAQALAAQLKLPYVQVEQETVSPRATQIIGQQLARLHTCMPLRASIERIVVAMANPLDLVALDDLRLASGRVVEPVVGTARAIRNAIEASYPPQ